MKKKILFTASIPLHFKAFHLPYLEWFQNQGYETHVACNGHEDLPYVDKFWDVPFMRSPFSLGNFRAFRELKKIIDQEEYVLIHCHTPMVSVLTRLASLNTRKLGAKLLYTAHGFHFFKGATLLHWMLYYPVEIVLSKYTDAIICINQEDFDLISVKGNKGCDYFLIPGIGVNNARFFKVDVTEKLAIRETNNFLSTDFLLIYAAEYIHRKNHEFIIEVVKNNVQKLGNVKILFAGKGILEEKLKKSVVEFNLQNTIYFLGFRRDIDQVYKMSDVGISSSKQEGLGLNLVEEMMCGLPVIATVDRGHKEVIDHESNGYLYSHDNQNQFLAFILALKDNDVKREEFSRNATIKAEKFEVKNSLMVMSVIYKKYLGLGNR
jgi:glycosyltransferase EpsD